MPDETTDQSKPRVVALIPAYNEVAQIERIVRGASGYADAVVVIDDGSDDGTAAAAALAGAAVIAHPTNRGKGAALRSGFTWAVRHGADLAFTLDADGQHDPEEMPAFLEMHERTGADLIIGQRTYAEMPRVRRWANRTGRRLLSLAMGQDVPDNQCGYRLYSRRLMMLLQEMEGEEDRDRFSYEVEVIALAVGAGYTIAWVPVRTIYGNEQSHFHPIRDSLDFLSTVWRVWRMRRAGARHHERATG
ncbi:MAG: glycosyltransferase family 2 protein [Chloroflexi bacterium]|nr:glycosyltransferase family 2 protein [Chloroflexota bacterium]